MPDRDQAYADILTTQLQDRHPDLLSAENDLALLRARLAIVTTWIHEDAWDDTARRTLAQRLGLPEPNPPKPQ
ncbi:hypothetical protein [Streptomyces sp. NPDC007991]|uniref:hypothetical protein n=1 Tax=Streptomyces sp. NPDC007991 TaxID=3364803 RepID=UPI0036ED9100